MKPTRGITIGYWTFTALFALQLGFTAYAQLALPQVAQAFAHLGFSDTFRIALSWVKFAGLIALLAPFPVRLKHWAYAGFAFNLVAAVVAHLRVGDGVASWGWPVGALVLEAGSYYFFRKKQTSAPGRLAAANRSVVAPAQ